MRKKMESRRISEMEMFEIPKQYDHLIRLLIDTNIWAEKKGPIR